MNKKSINKRLLGIASILLMLAFPLYLSLTHTPHEIESAQSFCPVMMTTGFPCPGCGISKSMMYLYQGDLFASLHHHLLGPLFFILCWITLLLWSAELLAQRVYFQKNPYNKSIAYFLGFSIGIYHFIRLGNYIFTNSWTEIMAHSIWF